MEIISKLFGKADYQVKEKGLPTGKELNPYRCLDGNYAERHFKGKALSDAEKMLSDGSDYYYGDLMWMGSVAFYFYIPAVLPYLSGNESKGDADVVNQLHGIIDIRLQEESFEVERCRNVLLQICDYILENYDKFEVCEIYDKYDALEDRRMSLLEQFERLRKRVKGEQTH